MLDPRFAHLTPTQKAELLLASVEAAQKADAARQNDARLDLDAAAFDRREANRFHAFCTSRGIDAGSVLRPGSKEGLAPLLHSISLEVAEDPSAIAEVARLAPNHSLEKRAEQQLKGYAQVARSMPLGTEETDAFRAATNALQWLTGRERNLASVIAGSPADSAQMAALRWAQSNPAQVAQMPDWKLDLKVEEISRAQSKGDGWAARATSQAPAPPERLSRKSVDNLARFGQKEFGHSLNWQVIRALDNGDYIRHAALASLEEEQKARSVAGLPELTFRGKGREPAYAQTREKIIADQGGPRPARSSALSIAERRRRVFAISSMALSWPMTFDRTERASASASMMSVRRRAASAASRAARSVSRLRISAIRATLLGWCAREALHLSDRDLSRASRCATPSEHLMRRR